MCTIVQIVNSQKNIYKKVTPNLTFTFCPNRKSKFTIKTNHISTTARGKFTICRTIVQIVYSEKNIYKKVTPIWPLLPVQTGSQSLVLKQIISQQPQKVNSQFVHYCTDRLFSKKYLQKGDPNLTFTFCPNRKSKLNIFKKIISQQPQEVNSQFLHHCTDR